MDKIAFITGAKGFIGRVLTKELVSRGYTVYGINEEADVEKVSSLALTKHTYPYSMIVFHAAWKGTSGPDRERYNVQSRNIMMSNDYLVDILNSFPCIAKVVNIGTFVEKLYCEGFINNKYAAAKAFTSAMMRHRVHEFSRTSFINAMLTNVYGPSEGSTPRLVSTLVRKMMKGMPIEFSSNGNQPYEFLYETDAAHIIVDVAENAKKDVDVLVCGTQKELPPFWKYIRDMASALGYMEKIKYGHPWGDGIYTNYYKEEIANRFKLSDWKPKTTFNQGVRKVAEAIKENDNG